MVGFVESIHSGMGLEDNDSEIGALCNLCNNRWALGRAAAFASLALEQLV